MSYSYRVQKQRKGAYTVYGIEAVTSAGEVCQSFPDVFFDKQEAERFAACCNDGELSPVQLRDAVEDALCKQYTVI